MYFTIVSVGLELVLGMAIAQLIHSHPWGWKFLRFSLIIPWAVPDDCQWRDVALDLQRRFRRVEWTA